MTVNSTERQAGPYAGTGSTHVFYFSFQVQQPSDVKVLTTIPGSADVTLTFGVDYAVGINTDQTNQPGGSVTLATAPAIGVYVTILRDIAVTQPAAFTNHGGFYPKVLENALDKLTLLIGQIMSGQDRSLKASALFSGDLVFPSPGAGNFLRWNLAGDALEAVEGTGTVPGDFLQSGAGAVARSLTSKLGESLSLKDFGAIGDGVADDTPALTAWLAALVTFGLDGFMPAGTYNFTSALQIPLSDNIAIEGAGPKKSILNYIGVTTTVDLITVGNGSSAYNGYQLRNFSIKSSTVMTAGNALRLRKISGAEVFGVDLSSANLCNGLWLDNSSAVRFHESTVSVSNDGVRISGAAGSDAAADVLLDKVIVQGCAVGVRIGGGIGRVAFGNMLAIGSTNANFIIDNSIAAQRNRDVLFSDQCVSDSCKNYGVYISDTLASGANILLNAQITNAGHTGVGGTGINLCVASWPSGRINLGAGQISNATSHGIRVDDASALVTIGDSRNISGNGGYGIYASVATSNIAFFGFSSGNTSGEKNSNVTYASPSPPLFSSVNWTAAKGHIAFGSALGGLIIQWGQIYYGDVPVDLTMYTQAFTFDIAFPNACLQVSPITNSTVAVPIAPVLIGISQKSVSGFTLAFFEGWSNTEDLTFSYIAIGN